MKANRNTVIRIICLLIFLYTQSLARTNDSLKMNDFQNRITVLEEYKREVLDQKFETKTEALSNHVNEEVAKAKNEIIESGDVINKKILILEIAGGVIAILILVGIGFSILKIKKWGEDFLKKRLENHLSENSEYIIEMITSHKTENLIKKKKKLIILSSNHESGLRALKLLKGMGFDKIEVIEVNAYKEIPESDLIVFADMDGTLDHNLIVEFMERSKEEASFVFFGQKLEYNRNADYAERLNFANSKHTLYHQIINTLTFKEVFKVIEND